MKIRRFSDTGEWTTRRYLSLLGNILIWAIVAIDGFYLWPTQLQGSTSMVIVSGHSMDPTYFTGDLVIARKMEPSVGDVIVYAPEGFGGSQIVHRIVGGNAADGWVMQGDNNPNVDPFTPKGSEIRGVVLVHYANFGRVTVLLLNPIVWALVLLAAVVLLVWWSGDTCEDDPENNDKDKTEGGGDPEPEAEGEPDLIDRMVEGTEAAVARMVASGADAGAAALAMLTRLSPAPRHAARAPRRSAPALLRGSAIIAALGLLAVYGPSTASASSLSITTKGNIFTKTYTPCTTTALTATPATVTTGTNYRELVVSAIPPACNGKSITMYAYSSTGTLLMSSGLSASPPVTTGTGGTVTFTKASGSYNAATVSKVYVFIDTWGIQTTWTGPPTTPTYRLESFNYPDYFIRHHGINAQAGIEEGADQFEASEFYVRDGLASGSGDRVSFESVDLPGYYLRRNGDELILDNAGGNFAKDATFIQVAGLADDQWWSFQSVSKSNLYIRHQNFDMWLDNVSAGGLTQLEREDTTFRFIEVN